MAVGQKAKEQVKDINKIVSISETIHPVKRAAYRHYGFHPWFTTRPYNVLQQYIQNFTNVGETVLDPFMGSGVTNTEALILRRKTIGVDLSPLAVFVSKMKCTSPIDMKAIDKEFQEITAKLKPGIEKLEKTPEKRIEKMKISYWYPNNVPLPQNSDRKFVHELFTKKQLICLSIIYNAIKQIEDPIIKDFFRLVFSGTLVKTNICYDLPEDGRSVYAGQCSVFSRGRYWVPTKTVEVPIWKSFEMRYQRVRKAKQETNRLIGHFYSEETCKCFKGDATELPLKDNSIDYCFTDPPYGAHIAYLDLTTMWNAWLGFNISLKERKKEIIEGGSLDKNSEEYKQLLKKSISEIYRVLKPNRWFSIIFHHKKIALWNYIVEGCQEAGFTYVNSVPQPPFLPSTHKIKNPLRVLAAELVLNFKKTESVTIFTPLQIPVKNLILNSAEKTIVRYDGATIDQIYQGLVPELVEAGMLEEAQKHYSDITYLLQTEFQLGLDGKWRLQDDKKLREYIPLKDRLKFYITSYLRREKKASFDEIYTSLLPNLINGKTPTNKDILDILNTIATPTANNMYTIREHPLPEQQEFELHTPSIKEKKSLDKLPKDVHSEMIYRLAYIGKFKYNFDIWMGKSEQSRITTYDNFEDIFLKEFPIKNLTEMQRIKVLQIDVLWFYKTTPIYAFEIEETTPITTALDRFKYLLELNSNLARRLVIVTPERRKRKLYRELSQSTYIGVPFYMENKVRYLFYQEIRKLYEEIFSSPSKFPLKFIDAYLNLPLENT